MKNSIFVLLLGILSTLCLISCTKDGNGKGIKCSIEDLTYNSVTLKFSAEAPEEEYHDASSFLITAYLSDYSIPDASGDIRKKNITVLPGKNDYFVTFDNLVWGTKYYARVVSCLRGKTVRGEVISFTTLQMVPEEIAAVDLGLPSGLKWGSLNVGADVPEDPGIYCQWAARKKIGTGIGNLWWDDCPYHNYAYPEFGWSRYIPSGRLDLWSGTDGAPDNLSVLTSEDDIAHIELQGGWRMPTKEDWEELMNESNCSWTRMSVNTKKGPILGYKIQSMKTGYKDNWIFLPAGGYWSGVTMMYEGVEGYYWSSCLDVEDPTHAVAIIFDRNKKGIYSLPRYTTSTVRPVTE